MAAQAGLAVVAVPGALAVRVVHAGLVVRVAGEAGELGEARRVHVAGGAAGPLSAVRARVDREEVPVVVEGRAVPPSGGVTFGAGRGESRGDVGRIGRAIVVALVTSRALGGGAPVHAVPVAPGARHRQVRAGERKRCAAVGEARGGPHRRGMTLFASAGKAEPLVI